MTEERKSMTDEEKTLLLEIDSLYKELLRETNPIWNGRGLRPEPSGYTYCRNAKLLQAKVNELWNEYKPDYFSDQELRMFQLPFSKEISNVERAYDLARKPRAAKLRNNEFIKSMHEANERIRKDLYSLFKEIEIIKEADKKESI